MIQSPLLNNLKASIDPRVTPGPIRGIKGEQTRTDGDDDGVNDGKGSGDK